MKPNLVYIFLPIFFLTSPRKHPGFFFVYLNKRMNISAQETLKWKRKAEEKKAKKFMQIPNRKLFSFQHRVSKTENLCFTGSTKISSEWEAGVSEAKFWYYRQFLSSFKSSGTLKSNRGWNSWLIKNLFGWCNLALGIVGTVTNCDN